MSIIETLPTRSQKKRSRFTSELRRQLVHAFGGPRFAPLDEKYKTAGSKRQDRNVPVWWRSIRIRNEVQITCDLIAEDYEAKTGVRLPPAEIIAAAMSIPLPELVERLAEDAEDEVAAAEQQQRLHDGLVKSGWRS